MHIIYSNLKGILLYKFFSYGSIFEKYDSNFSFYSFGDGSHCCYGDGEGNGEGYFCDYNYDDGDAYGDGYEENYGDGDGDGLMEELEFLFY